MRLSRNRRGTNQYQTKAVLLDSAICPKCNSICSTADLKPDEHGFVTKVKIDKCHNCDAELVSNADTPCN